MKGQLKSLRRARRGMMTLAITAGFAGISSVASAQAVTTLDFGQPGGTFNVQCLTPAGGDPFAAGYQGLDYNNIRSARQAANFGNCLATDSGQPGVPSISAVAGTAFSFRSAQFISTFANPFTLTVTGSLAGNNVFTQMLSLTGGSLVNLTSSNLGAVDKIAFTGTVPNVSSFELDNFAFAPASVTTTPEPSSIALLGTGIIGLVPVLRRKKNS